jgi:hypothetical protein
MHVALFLIFVIIHTINCYPPYVPGAAYHKFLVTLNETQKAEVTGMIFDPETSRADTMEALQKWAHSQSPLTEVIDC